MSSQARRGLLGLFFLDAVESFCVFGININTDWKSNGRCTTATGITQPWVITLTTQLRSPSGRFQPSPKEKRQIWRVGVNISGVTLKKIPSGTRRTPVVLWWGWFTPGPLTFPSLLPPIVDETQAWRSNSMGGGGLIPLFTSISGKKEKEELD